MANKPASRNWNDVQIALVAMSMAATLGLWNLFAEPDLVKARESAALEPVTPPPAEMPVVPVTAGAPTALPSTKILLGGAAPETVVVVQAPSRGNRNNGGGG